MTRDKSRLIHRAGFCFWTILSCACKFDSDRFEKFVRSFPIRCILNNVKKYAALLLPFLCALAAAGQAAKNPDCASVTVMGPAGIINPGDLATYTAKVDTGGRKSDLTYVWTAVGGVALADKSQTFPIESGQGTPRIAVRQPSYGLMTVSVEVRGLPPGCLGTASETSIIERGPQAEKLYQINSATTKPNKAELHRVASTLIANPNSQLFIIRGSSSGRTKEPSGRLEEIIRFLLSEGLGKGHITVTAVNSKANVLEFWRVPPGAESPTRLEPTKSETGEPAKDCPTIAVEGPFDVTSPAQPFVFTAKITGKVPKNVKYSWKASSGQILEGQGTKRIAIYNVDEGRNPIATLTVIGLPKGCPNSVIEMAPFVDGPVPVLINEYSTTDPKYLEREIGPAVKEFRQNPDNLLYIIQYFTNETSEFAVRGRVRQISEFLENRFKLSENEFRIVTTDFKLEHTKIYRIPPGAELPAP